MGITQTSIVGKVGANEISIDTHGLLFMCIVGNHVNGGFVAIPNWSISAELAKNEKDWNEQQIRQALKYSSYASMWADEQTQAEIAKELADILTAFIR